MHSTQLDVFTANTFIRHRVKNTISSDMNMTATALGFGLKQGLASSRWDENRLGGLGPRG